MFSHGAERKAAIRARRCLNCAPPRASPVYGATRGKALQSVVSLPRLSLVLIPCQNAPCRVSTMAYTNVGIVGLLSCAPLVASIGGLGVLLAPAACSRTCSCASAVP